MRHPNQATLALHAGGDLGAVKRWFTTRHLTQCALCREEVAGFHEMRELLPNLAELPDISWNRMAAEIKANVRLGLEAGECVRGVEMPLRIASPLGGWRAVVAFASVIMLVGGCMVLERPTPVVHLAGSSVQSSDTGVQTQSGDERMLGLSNSGAQRVTYTMSAQGSVGARYVDPVTGVVTINTVYATQ